MINLAAAFKESRQGLLLGLGGTARCLSPRQGSRKEVKTRPLSHTDSKKTWGKRGAEELEGGDSEHGH